MSQKQFKKVKEAKAAEVCQRVELEQEAAAILNEQQSPEEFLEQLIGKALYPDAIRFLSQALSNREATWWACLSVRAALQKNPPSEVLLALDSAEKWVYKPTDENRLTTFDLAEKATFDAPASWAAMAAFWSGGNISPQSDATVEPAADLNGKAVAGAVMLAAVKGEPSEIEPRYQEFLRQGIDIACGGDGRISGKDSHPSEEQES